jgi:uncharacterized membrane protein YgdD (TMEM256/DUF423 family)
MNQKFKILGAVFGMTAVIIGAFGAHGLEDKLDVDSLKSFETGVKYQMYHALLLLILGFNLKPDSKYIKAIFYLFLIGIIFFSVSIYVLATNTLTPFFDFTTIALITPIGGTLLITGWILLIFSFIKKN